MRIDSTSTPDHVHRDPFMGYTPQEDDVFGPSSSSAHTSKTPLANEVVNGDDDEDDNESNSHHNNLDDDNDTVIDVEEESDQNSFQQQQQIVIVLFVD